MDALHAVVALLTGLVVGSFLNVVIWRLPRGENLSKPRSHCPGCGALIRWFDNIPLLSWLLLRGRCRGCGTPIAVRYPLVETLTGVLLWLAWQQHGASLWVAVLVALFLAALVAISFIDLDHRIIPDRITKPGMVFYVALAPLGLLQGAQVVAGAKPALNAWLAAALGCAVGAGVILLIRAVGSWILKKEAMGLGDVKLLGLVGAVVGWLQALYALALACLGGAVIGGIMFAVGKRRAMPAALTVRCGETEAQFDRVRVRDERIWVRGAPPLEAGASLRLQMVLPAVRILEDHDAELRMEGRLAEVAQDGDAQRWSIEVTEAGDLERERLAFFAQSYRYIPFGPFLALGGALAALYGDWVHWFITDFYPGFTRGLLGR